MKLPTLMGARSFAHLAGLARPSAAKAESDDEPDDKDRKDAKRAEDDEPEKDDDRKDDARRADADDPDKDDDDDKRAKRAKRADADDPDDGEDDDDKKDAKRADADDDDDTEMRGKSAVASARRRERARCAAIFASPAAARNPALAANLAFRTALTRQEAIAVLADSAPAAAVGDRASRNPRLGAGGEPAVSSKQAIARSWDAAMQRVGRK